MGYRFDYDFVTWHDLQLEKRSPVCIYHFDYDLLDFVGKVVFLQKNLY